MVKGSVVWLGRELKERERDIETRSEKRQCEATSRPVKGRQLLEPRQNCSCEKMQHDWNHGCDTGRDGQVTHRRLSSAF